MKLDLHTHCIEALGFPLLSREAVGRIVEAVKEKGLDGIAITEHGDRYIGFQVRDIVKHHFHNEVLIIPGQEVDRFTHHVVELYLPGNLVFRFIAHPGFPSKGWEEHLGDIQGIEIENGNHSTDRTRAEEIAQEHNLLLLSNSDAHSLQRLGLYYNELELEELCSRAFQREDIKESLRHQIEKGRGSG